MWCVSQYGHMRLPPPLIAPLARPEPGPARRPPPQVNQRAATAMLKRCSVAPRVANNGQEAVDAVRETNGGYQVIFMDIQSAPRDADGPRAACRAGPSIPRAEEPTTADAACLYAHIPALYPVPLMDGLEATRQIRAFERERGLPRACIIALTGARAGAAGSLFLPLSGAHARSGSPERPLLCDPTAQRTRPRRTRRSASRRTWTTSCEPPAIVSLRAAGGCTNPCAGPTAGERLTADSADPPRVPQDEAGEAQGPARGPQPPRKGLWRRDGGCGGRPAATY